MIDVSPLIPDDRAAWESLARGYKAFYETTESDDSYETAWHRLLDGGEVLAIGARVDGKLVGVAHYLFHTTVWTGDTCYLQDLFVVEHARGQGAARALIENIAEMATVRGATRLYWMTQEDNARARALYDSVADFRGFIRYERPLGGARCGSAHTDGR